MTDDPRQPAAESAPEAPVADAAQEDFQLPEWVNTDPAEWGGPQEAAPAPPQYPPQYVPQYAPPPPVPVQPWQPPKYSGDDLLERSSDVVDGHVRAYARPLAEAYLALKEKLEALEARAGQPQLHPVYVQDRWREVQNTVGSVIKDFSEDPAYRDPKVRSRVESYLQGTMGDAYERARRGDFQGVDALRNPAFLYTVFDYAKRMAGWTPTSMRPVDNPQATLQSTRPSPTPRRPKLTEEEIETLKFTGVSEEEYLKMKSESEKFGG